MNDAGIDRRAANAQRHQTNQRTELPRQQDDQNADRRQPQPGADHGLVAETIRNKSIQKTAKGNAQKVQAGKAGGSFRLHAPGVDKITAGPQPRRAFHGAVAKKRQQNQRHAR